MQAVNLAYLLLTAALKRRIYMKNFYKFLAIFVIAIVSINISTEAQVVYYVGNGGVWENWDIYSFDIGSDTETRLTTSSAIDNHPSISSPGVW